MNQTEDERPERRAASEAAASEAGLAEDDSRVIPALQEYQAALKAGHKPNRQEFQARYPEIAEALAECLDGLEFVHVAAPQLSQPGAESRAAAAASATDIQPEGPLGDYRIVREIGRGGMGVVYEAVQISLGRRVALKVLPFAAAMDAKQLQRFKNEAHAAAQLHHTNIVPVFGVGCERGVHFYAMQFIDGQTLAAMIRELRQESGLEAADKASSTGPAAALAGEMLSGRWPPAKAGPADPQPTGPRTPAPEPPAAPAAATATQSAAAVSTEHATKKPPFFRTVAQLGVQVAEALEHAHQFGVVHRDIKPANLLLDRRGNLWIADFGLAHCHSQAGLTMSGDLVGTLRYMSPEQALAKRVLIDHRTDIYSLGVTLYELLTLQPVFDGRDRQELLRQIAFEEPRSPRRLNKAIPTELETIVLKAVAKNPEERYATAQELADDLARFLEDKPIKAKRATLRQWAVKWARRHRPVVIAAVASLVVVLLSAVVVLAVSNARINEEQKQTKAEQRKTAEALIREEQTSYFQRIALAERELADHRVGSAEELLEHCPPHLRGWEWIYLKRRRYQEPLTIQVSITDQALVAFSPDGKLLASAGDQHVVEVWDARNGQKLFQLPGHTDKITALVYSPDGRFLASTSWDATVRLWDTANRQSVLQWDRPTGRYAGIEFSPDGHRLASRSRDRTVQVWDVTTGRVDFTLHADPGEFNSCLAFSPDGNVLATATEPDHAVQLWDARTGEEVRPPFRGHTDLIDHLAFSPDGKLLATASRDYTAKIWDTQTGQVVHPIRGHSRMVYSVAFSSDGRRLATAGADTTVKLWDPLTGQEALTLRGHGDPVHWAAFSRDGHRLASASWDGTVKVWDATPLEGKLGQELFTLYGHEKNVRSLTFSPDGKALASTSEDQTIKLTDASTGQELRTLRGHTHTVWDLRFSGDGRRLASASADGTVRLWDATTGQVIRKLGTGLGTVESVAYHPDNQRVAAGSIDGTVRIWNAQMGQELLTFQAHSRQVPSLVFSPDGQYLVSASSDRTRTIAVWDATTGKLIRPLLGHTRTVWGVTCSRDGRRLASASWDGTARVWDLATGKELLTFRGHRDWVYSVTFSPDGRFLASGGQDAVVRVWDATSGEEKAILRGHSDRVLSVAFSPDGQRLASSSGYRDKGEVKIWDVALWDKKANGKGADPKK